MIGWAAIGIGVLADRFIAPAIARQPDSRLVAVCSREMGRANDFAQRHGADGAYDDYDEMLGDPAVDVVYIATPNGLHQRHVVAALEAGHHVLVDKPMALTVADGREMVATAARCDRLLGVAFQMRHKATNRAARELIAHGRLGTVRVAELCMGAGRGVFPYDTWRADPVLAGGGTMLNQGTHAIDLLRMLTGREVAEVTCTTSDSVLEDVMAATFTLDDGTIANVLSHSVRAGPPRVWHVVGSRGCLEGRGALSNAADDALILHGDDGEATVMTSPITSYEAEIEAFAAAVAGTAPVDGDGRDGLCNIAVVEALYRAARERRTVAVEPI